MASPAKTHPPATPADAVQVFLRDELHTRYLARNVRRFPEFAELDPGLIRAYRDFALLRLYPLGAQRAEIDHAFAALHEILHSPAKMASLGAMVVGLVWKLGRRLPATLAAGKHVIDAFSAATAVETALVETVVKTRTPWKSGLDRRAMSPVFAALTEDIFENLVRTLERLLDTAANRDTMETGIRLLDAIAETMRKNAHQWSDADRHGVNMARETLGEALRLFACLHQDDVPLFIKGVAALERDWYRALRREG